MSEPMFCRSCGCPRMELIAPSSARCVDCGVVRHLGYFDDEWMTEEEEAAAAALEEAERRREYAEFAEKFREEDRARRNLRHSLRPDGIGPECRGYFRVAERPEDVSCEVCLKIRRERGGGLDPQPCTERRPCPGPDPDPSHVAMFGRCYHLGVQKAERD